MECQCYADLFTSDYECDHEDSAGIDEEPSPSSGDLDSDHEASVCDFSCCTDSELSQPIDKVVLKRTEKQYGSGKSLRKRCFLASWYKTFPWLHLCRSTSKVFCYYCRAACKSHITVMSTKADPAFSTSGYSNWKKAVDKFREHEQSLAHKDALKAHASTKNLPVSALLQKNMITYK